MHRVIFSDGRKTKPLEIGDIRQLFAEEKIPADAVVEQLVPIADFVSPDLQATEKQKQFATNLGIPFHPMIGRRAISKLIDETLDAQDEDRLDQMLKVGAGEQAARALLV